MVLSSPVSVKGPRRAAAPVLSSGDRQPRKIDKERRRLPPSRHPPCPPSQLSKSCREQRGQASVTLTPQVASQRAQGLGYWRGHEEAPVSTGIQAVTRREAVGVSPGRRGLVAMLSCAHFLPGHLGEETHPVIGGSHTSGEGAFRVVPGLRDRPLRTEGMCPPGPVGPQGILPALAGVPPG